MGVSTVLYTVAVGSADAICPLTTSGWTTSKRVYASDSKNIESQPTTDIGFTASSIKFMTWLNVTETFHLLFCFTTYIYRSFNTTGIFILLEQLYNVFIW
jgi:hypothetical protein